MSLFGGQAFRPYYPANLTALAPQSDSMGVLAGFARLVVQFAARSGLNDTESVFHGV